jgi:hypothetical protein
MCGGVWGGEEVAVGKKEDGRRKTEEGQSDWGVAAGEAGIKQIFSWCKNR